MLRSIDAERVNENWLITAGAGFIGQHLTEKLLSSDEGFHVVIVDNLRSSNSSTKGS
jgi:nucleoside-diphosphate-sugar epimerase